MDSSKYFIPHMRVGNKTKVKHEDGKGGIKDTEGKLLNPDDRGYVVIENELNGELRYIPKEKITEIIQSMLEID